MSALTDEELQRLAIEECDAEAVTGVEANISAWWKIAEQQNASSNNLETYTRFKLQVLRFVRGKLRKRVDTTQGADSIKASQQFKHAGELIAECEKELAGFSIPTTQGVGSVRPTPYSVDKTDRRPRVWP